MRPSLTLTLLFSSTLAGLAIVPQAARADQWDAARLLPDSTVVYVEIVEPPKLLATIFEHPLRKRVESLSELKQALDQPQMRQLRMVVEMVETNLKMDLLTALSGATHQGAWLAVDGATQGVVLLVRASNAEVLANVRETLFTLARAGALGQQRPDPIQQVEYRGLTAFRADQLRVVAVDDWLVLSNHSDLAKKIIDQHLDGGATHLASSERFSAAYRDRPQDEAGIWTYVDLHALRQAGVAPKVFAGKSENPAAELLFGGPLSNLQHTPYATAWFQLNQQSASLALNTPHDPSWIGPEREFYFGPGGLGQAPPLLEPDRAILSLSAYRGVDQMWLHAGDLFDQAVSDQFAQADSNLTTLFAGRDFGEDVLGALQPNFQLVVARQVFGEALPQPAIKLPEFAVLFRLRDAQAMRDEFRRTVQSLIGFLNVAGAQQGNPQLDFTVERDGPRQIVASEYVPEDNEKDSRQARIVFNFSPTVAFEGDLMALSSTSGLVRRLQADAEPSEALNLHARLFAQPLREILHDNRMQLVAQTMLDEGKSKEQAERQIDLLLEIAGWFSGAELRVGQAQKELQVRLRVDYAPLEVSP